MVENYNIRLSAGFGAGAANAGSIGNGRIMAKQLKDDKFLIHWHGVCQFPSLAGKWRMVPGM